MRPYALNWWVFLSYILLFALMIAMYAWLVTQIPA